MPDDVRDALESRGLADAYEARPAYQRNDYLGWMSQARRPQTRAKRLQQMLDELTEGGIYMGNAPQPLGVMFLPRTGHSPRSDFGLPPR